MAKADKAKADEVTATYNPPEGEPKTATVFDQKIEAGKPTQFPARFAAKLRSNPHFELAGEPKAATASDAKAS